MVRSPYQFQMYYQVGRVLERLQVSLPHKVLMQLTILIQMKNFSRFMRIMDFLTILLKKGRKICIGLIREVLNCQTIT